MGIDDTILTPYIFFHEILNNFCFYLKKHDFILMNKTFFSYKFLCKESARHELVESILTQKNLMKKRHVDKISMLLFSLFVCPFTSFLRTNSIVLTHFIARLGDSKIYLKII